MRTKWNTLLILLAAVFFSAGTAAAQEKAGVRFIDASQLTLVGKMMDTPNPYWRVDTTRFKGFTPTENNQVRCGAGLAVAFRTDSPFILLRCTRRKPYNGPTTAYMASAGFDLYIREDGRWLWADNLVFKPEEEPSGTLAEEMDGTLHDCLLYLPIHTELYTLELGFAEESLAEALENPFRHRIVFSGSSYTHGSCSTRPGMSYPSIFERHTGLQVLPLGCGGNGRLQPYYADVFCAVEADAFVFDQFSNPNADMIRERFFPFLEKIRAAHPGVPIIFQQTIRRERRNFNRGSDAREAEKIAVADSVMRIAVKRYPDVYFIRPSADDGSHEWTVDGTHPDDYGYWLWSRSIEKPIRRILRRYGIR